MHDWAVFPVAAAAAVNFGDVGGIGRRTVVEARVVGSGAVGACGVVVVGCGSVTWVVNAWSSRSVERRWLRQQLGERL